MQQTEPTITVRNCQRCGRDHPVTFQPLTDPADIFTHWAMCPNLSQPTLLSISFRTSTPRHRDEERQHWLASLPGNSLADARADYWAGRPEGDRHRFLYGGMSPETDPQSHVCAREIEGGGAN